MVSGIDTFREYFVAHQDQYAIIGGAADVTQLVASTAPGLGIELNEAAVSRLTVR